MGDLLANPRVQFALVAAVLIVVGIVIGAVISSSREVVALGDRIIVSTGSGSKVAEDLPLTAAEATAAGWRDLVRCFRGRGRYFEKMDATGQPGPYLLMFNDEDELVGVYLVSRIEMPVPPWEYLKEGLIGVMSYEFEHWGLPVYFKDPTLACGAAVAGGRFHD